jgi:hypothetical protein
MAEDLVRIEPEDDGGEAKPAATASSAETPGLDPPPYQSRFQLLFGVLLGVALAAVAATVLFTVSGKHSSDSSAPTWADWQPSAKTALDEINQIAEHVGQRYTLPSGNQLVGIRASALELAGLPVTVALNDGRLFNDAGVMYTFCGLGKGCSIKEGKPSVARQLVLQRESLEVALYTFRYVKNTDEVVIILPPRPGTKNSNAMFYRRSDFLASLNRPLWVTLPGLPPAVNKLTKAEGDFIGSLTTRNLFSFKPQQGPDAQIYMVLTPLAP